MKHITTLFLPLLLLSYHYSFSQCSLAKPNAVVTSWTSCDAVLEWSPVTGAAYYEVRYKISSASNWTLLTTHISGTSYTFTNLNPGIEYKFGVASFCSNGFNSGYKNAKKTTPLVNIPEALTATATLGTAVSLTWTEHCPVGFFNVRYKENAKWVVLRNIPVTTFTVINLTPNKLYSFQVQGQTGGDTSKWTNSLKVNSGVVPPPPPSRPNIILYMLDDGRFDPYQPNGGPAWFNTPSINRIANEGINFTYAFPTTSQCAPSRVSIYTGLYAHKTGVIDNNSRRYDGLTLVQQVLKDAGYYTGFVGKFGQFQGDPVGFNWWATSDGNVYTDPDYRVNGRDTLISGHISDVYQDFSMTFLNSVPAGKPFMLMFFTRVPHSPTVPRSQDLDLYTDEDMPYSDNFNQMYQFNYPSYFYGGGHKWNYNNNQSDSLKLIDFQCLHGAERNVDALISWLSDHEILDSTMIIFTSDNGFLEGEHKLEAKQIAQEESIRVPMFIRYPKWFGTSGIVSSDLMVANVDVAPTLLEAAGVPDTANMDGTSMHKLFTQEVQRKYFYYQFAQDDATPPIRAVRSTQYKYVKHYCNTLTEEFYDLINDPAENTNQINNPSYATLIATYRNVRDSIALALNDTTPASINCFLSNPQFGRNANEETEELNLHNIEVYPNPASDFFIVHFNDEIRENIEVRITNLLNEKVYYKTMPNTNSFNFLVSSGDWLPGVYLVTVKKGTQMFHQKFSIQ